MPIGLTRTGQTGSACIALLGTVTVITASCHPYGLHAPPRAFPDADNHDFFQNASIDSDSAHSPHEPHPHRVEITVSATKHSSVNNVFRAATALLVSADPTIQQFGWSTIAAVLRNAANKPDAADVHMTSDLIAKAMTIDSPAALKAIEASYLDRGNRLRTLKAMLSTTGHVPAKESDAAQLWLLGLAQVHDNGGAKSATPTLPSSSADDRQLLVNLLQGDSISDSNLASIFQRKTWDGALAVTLVAPNERLRRSVASTKIGQLRLLEGLQSWPSSSAKTSVQQLIAQSTRESSVALLSDISASLSVSSTLEGIPVDVLTKPDVPAEGTVSVSPAGRATQNDPRYGQSYVDASSVLPAHQLFTDNSSWIAVGLGDEWSAVNGKGTPMNLLAAYAQVISQGTLPDLAGVPVRELGVKYKHWAAGTPATGGISYHLRIGYRPSQGTLWVAARWQSSIGSASHFAAVSGTYGLQPIAVEAETGWALYPVTPSGVLEFDNDVSTTFPVANGFLVTNLPINREILQVIDINAANCKHIIDTLAYNAMPIDLASATSHNALIAYAALIRATLEPGGWLRPTELSPEQNATLALARLSILGVVARTDVQTPGVTPDTYKSIQWHERQAFLRQSLPLIAFAIYTTFGTQLEHDLLLTNAYLPRITATRDKITDALKALSSLNSRQGNSLLESAASTLNLNRPDDIKDMQLLAAALIGAQESVANLEKEATIDFRFRARLLKLMQFPGYGGIFQTVSDPKVLWLIDAP